MSPYSSPGYIIVNSSCDHIPLPSSPTTPFQPEILPHQSHLSSSRGFRSLINHLTPRFTRRPANSCTPVPAKSAPSARTGRPHPPQTPPTRRTYQSSNIPFVDDCVVPPYIRYESPKSTVRSVYAAVHADWRIAAKYLKSDEGQCLLGATCLAIIDPLDSLESCKSLSICKSFAELNLQ